ncbi:MAG TPA: SLBB domain-containing protein [Polyangium sp.]|nr:SLBB domain-containing protein [Polyangium sp.]
MQRNPVSFIYALRIPSLAREVKFVRLGRSILSFSIWVEFGCNPAVLPAPTFPAPGELIQSPTAMNQQGLSDDSPPAPTVLPGDMLRLQIVSPEAYEPIELWVNASGQVHVPLGGDVAISGLTLTDAEQRIEQKIQQYDKFARVNLIMQSFSGHRVIVSGAVDKPGAYEARPGVRIADVVAQAGGVRVLLANGEAQEAADIDAARIVRQGKTLPISIKFALVGEPLHNVYVRPGDIIFIPWLTNRQIPVLGDVKSARNVPYHQGLRLTEALAAAGGAARTADTADVRIVRGPLSRAKVYRANLDDLMTGATTDIELVPGDVIFVTEHWFATATDVINRLTPILAAATVYSVIAH